MLYFSKIITTILLLCGHISSGSLIAASTPKSSSKNAVPSELQKIGYFETIESEVYDSREALQLNSYYYDQNGALKKPLFVWTLVRAENGKFEGIPEWTQEIYYDKKVISTSKKVTFVTKNGVPTVQHWHKHFAVETNEYGQTIAYSKEPIK